MAKLQPGDEVRYKDEKGKIIKGVFFKFTDYGKPIIGAFDPDDDQDIFANVPPVYIVFDDESQAEHEPEDDEDIADEFPRT